MTPRYLANLKVPKVDVPRSPPPIGRWDPGLWRYPRRHLTWTRAETLTVTLAGAWQRLAACHSEERAILCESGARPGVYGLLVKCGAMSLFERS